MGAADYRLTYNESAAHYHVLGSCSKIHEVSCDKYDNQLLYGTLDEKAVDIHLTIGGYRAQNEPRHSKQSTKYETFILWLEFHF